MTKITKQENKLDLLLPEEDIILNGERIEVRPPHFLDLPKVMKCLFNMGTGIATVLSNENIKFKENGSPVFNQEFFDSVGVIVEEHFIDVVQLIALYTNKPIEFYANRESGLDMENGIILLGRVVERNFDFFTKHLKPMVMKLLAEAETKNKEATKK